MFMCMCLELLGYKTIDCYQPKMTLEKKWKESAAKRSVYPWAKAKIVPNTNKL